MLHDAKEMSGSCMSWAEKWRFDMKAGAEAKVFQVSLASWSGLMKCGGLP